MGISLFLFQYTVLFQHTIFFACMLLLVALAGCFAEHSGIINIGLEGIMIIATLSFGLTCHFFCEKLSILPLILVILSIVIVCGIIYSLFLAVASIHFKADQILVGTSMNLFALYFAIFMATSLCNTDKILYVKKIRNAFILNINNFEFNWIILISFIILVFSYVVLYHTKFGIRLRSCGEYPQASESVGINVVLMRYLGVIISGLLSSLGGIMYALFDTTIHFKNGVEGFGFLALAIMIFGQWNPKKIAIGALLFGFLRAFSHADKTKLPFHIDGNIYNMLPFLICLIVLIFTSAKSRAPKAEGIPYDPSAR